MTDPVKAIEDLLFRELKNHDQAVSNAARKQDLEIVAPYVAKVRELVAAATEFSAASKLGVHDSRRYFAAEVALAAALKALETDR